MFRKTWERKQKLCICSDPCCPRLDLKFKMSVFNQLHVVYSIDFALLWWLVDNFYHNWEMQGVRKGTEQRLVLSKYQRFHTFIITVQMKNCFSLLTCLKSSCQNCSGIQKPILIQISCKSSLLDKYYNFS